MSSMVNSDPKEKQWPLSMHETASSVRWLGEFADPALEDAYMADEVAPVLPWRVAFCVLGCSLVIVVLLVIETATSHHANVGSRSFMAVALMLWLVIIALSRLAALGRVAARSLEMAWALVYGFWSALMLIGYGRALDWLAHDADALAAALLGSFWPLYLQQQVTLIILVLMVPMRPRACAMIVGQFTLGTFVSRAFEHLTCSAAEDCAAQQGRMYVLSSLALGVAIMCGSVVTMLVCAQLSHLNRVAYACRQQVGAANAVVRARDAEDAERLRKEEHVEAMREARSRLIRIVMHDLRSPLLSVIAVSSSLRERAEAESEDSTLALRPKQLITELDIIATCASMMEQIVSDMLGVRARSILRVSAPSVDNTPLPFPPPVDRPSSTVDRPRTPSARQPRKLTETPLTRSPGSCPCLPRPFPSFPPPSTSPLPSPFPVSPHRLPPLPRPLPDHHSPLPAHTPCPPPPPNTRARAHTHTHALTNTRTYTHAHARANRSPPSQTSSSLTAASSSWCRPSSARPSSCATPTSPSRLSQTTSKSRSRPPSTQRSRASCCVAMPTGCSSASTTAFQMRSSFQMRRRRCTFVPSLTMEEEAVAREAAALAAEALAAEAT
jgi:signal transduction histidine kinase